MDYFRNISYTISHLFLLAFFYLFVQHRFSKRKTIGICFLVFMVLNITDILKMNIFPDSSLCYIVVTIFQIFVTQFTGLFLSSKRNSRVLFIGLSASNYVISGSILSSVLYIYTKSTLLALIGGFLLHLAVLIFLVVRIREIWLKGYDKESANNWWQLCLVPVLFYCGFSFIGFFPHTLFEYPDNIPGVLFFVLTMFISYVVVIRYVESESQNNEMFWKNIMVEAYIKGLENHYYLVERSEQNLKILRHDVRHYSVMIDSLLEQGEFEEIKKITSHINDVADENRVVKYCNNLIVNTILTRMIEIAESCDIRIQHDFVIEKEIQPNEYEFASVIANLLENAINCVKDFEKEKRYIKTQIHCTDEHLLIRMENEYETELLFDASTGLPKSRKGGNHGLGMQSVQAFMEQLEGNVGCYCEEGVFKIMLFAKF